MHNYIFDSGDFKPVAPMTRSSYVTLKVGRWNLADLVADPSGEVFTGLLDSIESELVQFEGRRETLTPEISTADFESLIHSVESISEKVSIASGFAHLQYYADTSSSEASALVTKIEKMASSVGNRMLFFDLWFKKGIDDTNANSLVSTVAPVYREYLGHKRRSFA